MKSGGELSQLYVLACRRRSYPTPIPLARAQSCGFNSEAVWKRQYMHPEKNENMGLIKHSIYPASIGSYVKTDFVLYHREDVHSLQKGHTSKSNASSHFT